MADQPEVMHSIHKLVRDPVIVKSSINETNIFLECEELSSKDLNVAAPERSVDTVYSLESSVQVDVSLNLTFMDSVAVLCYLAMGSIVFMLLGWICWIILI